MNFPITSGERFSLIRDAEDDQVDIRDPWGYSTTLSRADFCILADHMKQFADQMRGLITDKMAAAAKEGV